LMGEAVLDEGSMATSSQYNRLQSKMQCAATWQTGAHAPGRSDLRSAHSGGCRLTRLTVGTAAKGDCRPAPCVRHLVPPTSAFSKSGTFPGTTRYLSSSTALAQEAP